ncbi:MAG: hypothetical protein AAGI67_07525 [Pseudomonadota bacterium]
MRILGILLALLLVAYLINQQLGSKSERSQMLDAPSDSAAAPKLPTKPGEVDQFGKDMKSYLDEEARKRAKAIDEADEG